MQLWNGAFRLLKSGGHECREWSGPNGIGIPHRLATAVFGSSFRVSEDGFRSIVLFPVQVQGRTRPGVRIIDDSMGNDNSLRTLFRSGGCFFHLAEDIQPKVEDVSWQAIKHYGVA
jgi:hypothetical protein